MHFFAAILYISLLKCHHEREEELRTLPQDGRRPKNAKASGHCDGARRQSLRTL
ncbi:hypothetical protein AVEN_158591-1, partial [Araneus ventricosus]